MHARYVECILDTIVRVFRKRLTTLLSSFGPERIASQRFASLEYRLIRHRSRTDSRRSHCVNRRRDPDAEGFREKRNNEARQLPRRSCGCVPIEPSDVRGGINKSACLGILDRVGKTHCGSWRFSRVLAASLISYRRVCRRVSLPSAAVRLTPFHLHE